MNTSVARVAALYDIHGTAAPFLGERRLSVSDAAALQVRGARRSLVYEARASEGRHRPPRPGVAAGRTVGRRSPRRARVAAHAGSDGTSAGRRRSSRRLLARALSGRYLVMREATAILICFSISAPSARAS